MPDPQAELIAVFDALDATARQSLLDFARFLLTQQPQAESVFHPPTQVPPGPPDETVVAALRRLRLAYQGLDTDSLLTRASALMGEHLMQGRDAGSVIADLERLFAAEAGRQTGASSD